MTAKPATQSLGPPMESPCVDICTVDQATRLCAGCGRSIDEISRWTSMGSAERRRIMNELAGRLKKT